jgi:hypothetical protein
MERRNVERLFVAYDGMHETKRLSVRKSGRHTQMCGIVCVHASCQTHGLRPEIGLLQRQIDR